MAALPGQRTFAQIVAEIGANIFEQTSPSSSTWPTDTSIKAIVNKHYRWFYSKYKFVWGMKETTFSTSANTTRYTMVDGNMEIATMSIANLNRDIQYMPRELFLKQYAGGWTTMTPGPPLFYVTAPEASNNAMQFDLWPTPDNTYTMTVNYRARFDELSADGDYPAIPPEYADILVHGPLTEIMTMLGDQRANYHKGISDGLEKKAWLQNENNMNYQNVVRNFAVENIAPGWPGLIRPYVW